MPKGATVTMKDLSAYLDGPFREIDGWCDPWLWQVLAPLRAAQEAHATEVVRLEARVRAARAAGRAAAPDPVGRRRLARAAPPAAPPSREGWRPSRDSSPQLSPARRRSGTRGRTTRLVQCGASPRAPLCVLSQAGRRPPPAPVRRPPAPAAPQAERAPARARRFAAAPPRHAPADEVERNGRNCGDTLLQTK